MSKHRWMTSALALSLLAGGVASAPATMITSVLAAEDLISNDVKVTFKNAREGVTYTMYQVFEGNWVGNPDKVLTNYRFNNAQFNKEAIVDGLNARHQLEGGGYPEDYELIVATADDVEDRMLEEFSGMGARDLRDFLKDKVRPGCEPTWSGALSEETPTLAPTVKSGFYLVTEKEGNQTTEAFVLRAVAGEQMEIDLKNVTEPVGEKHVHEDSTMKLPLDDQKFINGGPVENYQGYQDVADYTIGDDVPFILKVKNVPTSTELEQWDKYHITLSDTMSAGLDLNEDTIQVWKRKKGSNYEGIGETEEGNGYVEVENRKGLDHPNVTITPASDKKSFVVDIKFKDTKAETVNTEFDGYEIFVTFTAKLNTNAIVGKPADGNIGSTNHNDLSIKWNTDPDNSEETDHFEDYTVVFTYDFNFEKFDGKDQTKLDDAQFRIYYMEGNQKHYLTWNVTDPTPDPEADPNIPVKAKEAKVTGNTIDVNGASVWTSSKDYGFNLKGLDEGTYYLEEIKAPEGYNKLTAPTPFTIVSNKDQVTTVTTTNAETIYNKSEDKKLDNRGDIVSAENKKGTHLPETGGMGTTMFYTAGGLIVAGAGLYLITSKRMKKDED